MPVLSGVTADFTAELDMHNTNTTCWAISDVNCSAMLAKAPNFI